MAPSPCGRPQEHSEQPGLDGMMPDARHSMVRGRTDLPFPERSIGETLAATTASWPEHDALVVPDQCVRLTWRELDAAVSAFAAGLASLGLTPGDRVGLWAMNAAEWVIAQLATARAGLVLVTINPAYRNDELLHVLKTTRCSAVIVGPAHRSSDYPAMLTQVLRDAATNGLAATPDVLVQFGAAPTAGFRAWEEVAAAGAAIAPALLAQWRAVDPNLPVNIQFTSGTTGLPKGVTLTHRNIVNNGWFTGREMGITAADRLCLPVPLYHCFGMVTGVLMCLTHGAALVLPSPGFDAGATLNTIAAERCTALYGVPTMFTAMMAHPEFDSAALRSLRTGIMAGSLCPVELMQAAIEQMHMRDIAICYGMTEAPVSFQTAQSDPFERRLDTVGRVQPHIEAKLVDEHGAVVPLDTPGEICVRGYNTMKGYWENPQATAATKDADGWVHTGDLGQLDVQGYLRIVGRLKDMVIRGGENLYPKEIEEFLFRHPAVREVQVFGVADAVFGEELCAWIIPHAPDTIDEQAIRDFCRNRIAHHKVPRHIRFVAEFPMTITGKIQKGVLRAIMERDLAGLPLKS